MSGDHMVLTYCTVVCISDQVDNKVYLMEQQQQQQHPCVACTPRADCSQNEMVRCGYCVSPLECLELEEGMALAEKGGCDD